MTTSTSLPTHHSFIAICPVQKVSRNNAKIRNTKCTLSASTDLLSFIIDYLGSGHHLVFQRECDVSETMFPYMIEKGRELLIWLG